MSWQTSMAPHLALSAKERLKQTPVRATMALIIAWAFHTAGLTELVLPWLALSTMIQLIEYVAMEPFRRRDPSELTQGGYVLFALTSIGLFSSTFAVAVVVMWSHSDPALAATAVMALGGTLISNTVSGIASRTLFVIGAAPYLAALVAMPFTAAEITATLAPMTCGVVLFTMAVIAIWSRVNASRTREIRALEEAQHRLEQAEAAMADRAAMAAIVSHELRTPVSAILAGAHVIREGNQPEMTSQTADLIVDAGRLMAAMLNDLLDNSKIEARAMTLEARDFELGAFVADTERFWTSQIMEKGLELKSSTSLDERLWLRGDPYRLRQIVNNLMSNAIKFTPRGAVTLELNVTEHDGAYRRIRLTVRDQGIGIKPEAMDHLFTPFAQASSEVARTYGGTGLGLTVSRDLARLMGGDLTVDSQLGQGAAFTVEVVLPLGQPAEIEDTFESPTPDLARRLRILAVDDHEINRRTLRLVLQPLNVELTTANDGAEALTLLEDQAFDVVLMDVNMPGIDGNETTRRLRASGGRNAATPVIGFSAGTEAAQVAACRAAGMTDWLAKPLEPRRLYLALERATAVDGEARTPATDLRQSA